MAQHSQRNRHAEFVYTGWHNFRKIAKYSINYDIQVYYLEDKKSGKMKKCREMVRRVATDDRASEKPQFCVANLGVLGFRKFGTCIVCVQKTWILKMSNI